MYTHMQQHMATPLPSTHPDESETATKSWIPYYTQYTYTILCTCWCPLQRLHYLKQWLHTTHKYRQSLLYVCPRPWNSTQSS